MLVLLTSIGIRAENFTGNTYINFDARGYSAYNLSFFASIVPGGEVSATAYASFGSLSASSDGVYGEAGAGMYINYIHKVNGVWIADSVVTYELRADASGYDNEFYYNVPLPTSGFVTGYAYSSGYSLSVSGEIEGY